jgi:hypothetical protein
MFADSIKALVERKDGKGKDTCDMSDWWKANCAKLPAVLRAVRTNSTLVHLSVSLASSRQLSTNDRSSSSVSRSEGEGEEWVRVWLH